MEKHIFKQGDRVEIKKSTFIGKLFFDGKIISIYPSGSCVVRCIESYMGASVGGAYRCNLSDISRKILA
jgi:hypothetical protein